MSAPKLYTLREVSEILRLSKGATLNLLHRKQLPAVKVPGLTPRRPARLLVDEQDLCEYVERWKNGH